MAVSGMGGSTAFEHAALEHEQTAHSADHQADRSEERADARRDRDRRADRQERTAEAQRRADARAPAGSSQTLAAARLRHADLAARFRNVNQLRRMGQAAFGAAAAQQFRQEAARLVAEMNAEATGTRAPAGATAEQQEHHEGEQALRRYLVLREALETPEATPAVLERLERRIDQLLAQHASRIVGGLNISTLLESLHADVGERDRLRTHYHDAVTTHTSVAQTYDALLKAFGPERVHAALKTLRLAINEDMLAPCASADPKHLAQLVQDLQRVNELHALYNNAESLQKAFVALAQDRVRAEFIGRMLHLVIDGDSDVEGLSEWLEAAAGSSDGEGDAPPPRLPLEAGARRREAMRRFLHETVPTWLWKPQAREALFRR